MRAVGAFALLPLLLLASCAAPENPPLLSAQYPPNTSRNSEPQPGNSLPPGAANLSAAPGAMYPNYLSLTFGLGGKA